MEAKYPPIKDDPCYGSAGETCYFFYRDAIIRLWQDNQCFLSPTQDSYKSGTPLALCVSVNCNDVFCWACADAEDVELSEIEDLYRHYIADPNWGSVIWACKHRNLQPQVPMKRKMIKDGAWSSELEGLPKPPPS